MSKLERIRAWYDSGGRLKLPLVLRTWQRGDEYKIIPVLRRISDEVEYEAWQWLAFGMETMFGLGWKASLQKVGDRYTWRLGIGEKRARYSSYEVLVEITHWKSLLHILVRVPFGESSGSTVECKSLEDVNRIKTDIEECKREVEIRLNELLGNLLEKVEKWRDEYAAGWRLQFPLKFTARNYVLVVLDKMPDIAREICGWLAADMCIKMYEIYVKVAHYVGRAYAMWDESMVLYLHVNLTDLTDSACRFYFDVHPYKSKEAERQALWCASGEKAPQIVVMYDYLKREIEERLNGLLEKMFYG
jgi:hypothetical protein